MSVIQNYQTEFESFLKQKVTHQNPKGLYDPMHYILSLGGKRIRPVLTLLATDSFGEDFRKALYASLAIEIFHNFSLVHDDIMDKATLRRGQKTIHTRWNLNTAILSGDAMLILAYQYFENYEPEVFRELASIFSQTALEVCHGQQYDLDFETQNNIDHEQYLTMICYKTAVLVGASLKMGATIAKALQTDKQIIYDFGVALGMAFQIQDDYLDVFGDAQTFGKKIGGDILENKKTLLYLNAYQRANSEQRKELDFWYASKEGNPQEKIQRVTEIFKQTQSDVFIREQIQKYTYQAFELLEKLNIPNDKKQNLKQFGTDLMNRNV